MGMEVQKVRSGTDGLLLDVIIGVPAGIPRGVVQICHGMSEHKERYLPFMEYLNLQGFAAVIHDHRGHGNSVKKKGDLGYMYGGGGRALVEDTYQITMLCKKRFPDLPFILFGHSMGSLIARAYTKQYDSGLDMLILSGSPSENPMLGLGKCVAHLEKFIFGDRHKSCLIEFLSFGGFAGRFAGEKNRYAWICSDRDVYLEYERSPECGFVFTDDAYLALFELMSEVYSEKGWKCSRPDLPVLFIGGGDDPCIGNVRKFKKALMSMRLAGYRNVKGKLYPGMRHEILNERDKRKVYSDVCKYMKKQLENGENR
ncbi:alpha/beta fold hydrolase [Ruminococcus gauvreauii]|uniref:alpha/beta fold hydrolase n=1 Tax=Ruminococcus gauvreauii TaxID=438033 RepID=UPI0039844D4E